MYRAQGAVIIPQVVIADGMSSTAGTIDLLAVHTDGTLQVIDLKASKNSIDSNKYDIEYAVDEGSVFYDPSLTKNKQFKLSTRMQQNMQVNTYGRILENMGYTVRDTSETIHILVDIRGDGKKQKFTGDFSVEGTRTHKVSYSRSRINKIVPINKDVNYAEKIAEQQKEERMGAALPFETVKEQLPQDDVLDDNTYEALFNTVKAYKEKLITRKEAIILLRDKMKQSKNNKRVLSEIDNSIALINLSIVEGTVDVVYEELVSAAIKELEDFIEYANNPINFSKPEYINRILNFESLTKTFSGLGRVMRVNKDELNLNKRQLVLKDKLSQLLNNVRGDEQANGLIMKSTENYVRQYIIDNSNRTFTKEDLDTLMTMADDIGIGEFLSGDMATNKDTILQLMDKLVKSNIQKVHDLVDIRNDEVRRVSTKLEALSPRGNVDYSFMLQFDKDGKFTGRYVKKIGNQYWSKKKEIRSKLFNENAEWKKYIVKDNLEDYTDRDIKYNKELHASRQLYSNFNKAEQVAANTVKGYKDGDYHFYTPSFKAEREKFEVFIPTGRSGYWKKKKGVSYSAFQKYKTKYYESVEVNFANYDSNNNMNGTVQESTTMEVVKNKYKDIRPLANVNGEVVNMQDEKYIKVMELSPTATSLELAQKEFYQLWIKFYENELLDKLPSGVRDNMLGKTPIIKDNVIKSAHDKGPLLTSMWGKTTRGMKNLWQTTTTLKKVYTDENGDMVDTLPLFYVGNPRNEATLKKIDEKINQLTIDFNKGTISETDYLLQKAELQGSRQALQSQPSLEELSLDMGDNLLRFSAMAENYETMAEIEDTLLAMMEVLKNRSYNPSSTQKIVTNVKGKLKNVGMGKTKSNDSLIVQRANKFMSMIYYDNNKKTRGFADKVSSGLIQLGSATYVGFNVFGNINNYAVGRINNGIEMFGGRYFDSKSYLRAEAAFNGRVIQDFVKKAVDNTSTAGFYGKGKYKEYIPGSKYEALVKLYRMMDDKADLREQNKAIGKESKFREALSWAYLIQDGAEYNVQTKVGIAILMSKQIRNNKGEEMSLYDAYQYNEVTGELTLKKGFSQMVNNKPGEVATGETATVEFTEQKRYEIRNYIREVNKQIHGNYASVDRTVMQEWWLGNLAMQFHKWVAPAIKARFRPEYFDENLGWVEGRYNSFISFTGYALKNLGEGRQIVQKYKDMKGQKALTAITGVKRTVAEIGFIFASFAMASILDSLFDDDDDDKSRYAKRMENALIYQMRRQQRELMFFIPLIGFKEQHMMVKSPISATRTVNELVEAVVKSAYHPLALIRAAYNPSYNILKDKNYYYQRGTRKGQSKVGKEWGDVIPLWYTLNRWISYDTVDDWYVE